MDRPRLSAALAVMALVVGAGLAGCSPAEVEPLPRPPTTRPLESTTSDTPPPDYAAVRLEGVRGRNRTTVTMGPGRARLTGTVVGPEGPVPGAVVHVERLVGDASAFAQVTTGGDGSWALSGILGGRYRVRAWRSPDLAQVDPELLFLEATQSRNLNLAVARFADTFTTWAIAPNPAVVNQPANLVVRLSRRTVDDRGVVRTVPSPRVLLTLSGTGQWLVTSAVSAPTDASGSVEWNVVCLAPGPQPLEVLAGATPVPLDLPPCV